METNVSSEKILDESFSKKEVTFCDKSSILFYAAEEAVDSLNDSVIHTISNDNFPLLPEFSNMLQNSIDSDAKYASHQYLGNLPKAMVVLEKLPEALVHKHTYSNRVIECCLMPNVPQNTDKACSLKSSSSHHKKITEPVMSQTNPILKKNKYPIRNLKVSIPFKEIVSEAVDAYSESSTGKASKLNKIVNNVKTISRKASRNLSGRHLDQNLDFMQQSSLQNSFAKLPPSKEIETSKFLAKNSTEGKENIKTVDSDESTCIISQMNHNEASFDKYPCIHLEKLNLGPHLYGISSFSDCSQSKKDMPMDLQLGIGNAVNGSGLFTEKTLPLIEKLGLKTVNSSPPVIDTEVDSTSSEEIYGARSQLKDLLIDTLNEVPSGDDSVLFDHENSPKDISCLQTESIAKDTNCNKSACSSVDAYSESSTGKVSKSNKIVNVKTISRKASKDLSGRHLDQNLEFIQQSSLQNSFAKLPSSKGIETSNYLGKNSTEGKKNIKIVDSDASTCIVSQVNHSEVSFDKYPCIHLEKLNLGPYSYGISSSSDCSQSKKDMPMDLQPEVGNAMNASGLSTEKTLPLIEELSPTNVNFSPPVIDTEDDSTSSDAIFSEEIYRTRSILKDLLISNLNEVSSDDDSVLFDHENSPKDISCLQTENIAKDTNCNNPIPYKNTQNKFPIVLLERLNLPLSESYTNYGMNSPESLHTKSVPAVTNVPDLPIRIENVCSISRQNFYKMQKRQNKSSNQSFREQFNGSGPSIIKPKSNHVSPFNISESSSENDNIADISISSSDDSSSENDLPLITLSKQKLNLSHSFNLSGDSSTDDDIPLISPKSNVSLTLATKTKNSQVKSHKHKKKNSINDSSDCSSAMKKTGPKSQMSCNISKKTKKKCNKSVELIPSEKKKSSKKSLRKKQMKVYKMITKYLEMQIKSSKQKKKSKKRKNSKTIESVKLVSSNNESDTESTLSSDSITFIYDSIEQDHSYAQNKTSFQKKDKPSVQSHKTCHCESSSILERIQEHSYARTKNSFQKRDKTSAKKACCCVSSSTSKKHTKAKKRQKSIDKYRLGFLSNKLSLRYYNRFLASERLLLSKCKLKKNKKKEVKQLFNRLKEIGLMSLK